MNGSCEKTSCRDDDFPAARGIACRYRVAECCTAICATVADRAVTGDREFAIRNTRRADAREDVRHHIPTGFRPPAGLDAHPDAARECKRRRRHACGPNELPAVLHDLPVGFTGADASLPNVRNDAM